MNIYPSLKNDCSNLKSDFDLLSWPLNFLKFYLELSNKTKNTQMFYNEHVFFLLKIPKVYGNNFSSYNISVIFNTYKIYDCNHEKTVLQYFWQNREMTSKHTTLLHNVIRKVEIIKRVTFMYFLSHFINSTHYFGLTLSDMLTNGFWGFFSLILF